MREIPIEKIRKEIIIWLKEYQQKSFTKGFVIGVSGGIDSAVVSALCAETGLPTLCVTLPIHQSEEESSRAIAHIEDLKSRFPRSEERRVGKECRSRWWPRHTDKTRHKYDESVSCG